MIRCDFLCLLSRLCTASPASLSGTPNRRATSDLVLVQVAPTDSPLLATARSCHSSPSGLRLRRRRLQLGRLSWLPAADCNGGAGQTWSSSGGRLTVYDGAKCLDAYDNRTTAGTKVEIWTCNGQTNQQWQVNSNGTITGVQSGLCLDVVGAATF